MNMKSFIDFYNFFYLLFYVVYKIIKNYVDFRSLYYLVDKNKIIDKIILFFM